MDDQRLAVNLNIDMNEFEGRFSNMFQVATFGAESRLDCVFVDKTTTSDEGGAVGKVVARIAMTTESLMELRELLDRHIDGMTRGEADADGRQ